MGFASDSGDPGWCGTGADAKRHCKPWTCRLGSKYAGGPSAFGGDNGGSAGGATPLYGDYAAGGFGYQVTVKGPAALRGPGTGASGGDGMRGCWTAGGRCSQGGLSAEAVAAPATRRPIA